MLNCPDGQTACNGQCVDTMSDLLHCGMCGNPCGAFERCVTGTCACEEGVGKPCYEGPAGTEGVGACVAGFSRCVNGQWSACMGQVVPAKEAPLDAIDNDCDGKVDESP